MTKKKPHMEIDPSLIEDALDSVEKIVSKKGKEAEAKPAEEENTPIDSSEKGEFYDRLIRVTADFENFRKRVQRERLEYVRFAHEDLVKALLPVLDNFERALAHAEGSADVNAIREGVSMIFSQIQSTLNQFGIRSESAMGQPFDPLMHEAVSQSPSAEHPPSTVIEEHQKAYHLHERLLRPAMVTVSTEVGAEESASPTETEDSDPPSV
jgi:molecular chaperone GrpE